MIEFHLETSSRARTAIRCGDCLRGDFEPMTRSALIVVDRAAAAAHQDRVDALRAACPASVLRTVDGGESSKALAFVESLWTALAEARIDRNGVVVAVGGGALLDAVAFAAATWLRGVDLILVPTTLTGQVDAGLGGKSAVNFGSLKNQVGVIRAPLALWVDTGFLASLPEAEWVSGLGEVAKTALLCGDPLWTRIVDGASALRARDPACLAAVVEASLRFKASVVRDDPFDDGRRMILNAGHTLGHVLESAAMRRGVAMPHGVAVSIGLHLESRVVPGFDREAVRRVTTALGLPSEAPFRIDRGEALDALAGDKKRRGASIRIPVVEAPGVVSFHAASPEALAAAFDD